LKSTEIARERLPEELGKLLKEVTLWCLVISIICGSEKEVPIRKIIR